MRDDHIPDGSHERGSPADLAAQDFGLTLDDLRDFKRVRDELRRQIHRGQQEARERFQRLEDRWAELQRMLPDLDNLEQEMSITHRQLVHVRKQVVEDLKHGYASLCNEITLQVS